MKNVMTQIKHKGVVRSEIEIPVYESFQDMLNNEEQEKILALFNKQNKIMIASNERSKFSVAKTGLKVQRQRGFEVLTTEDLAGVIGDAEALDALLLCDETQKKVREKYPELGLADAETVEDASNDTDEDEL